MKSLLVGIILFFSFFSFAQKDNNDVKINEKVKFIYKDTFVETDHFKIYIVDAVATANYSKFKLRVFNKTNDYLLVKPAEFALIAGGGNFSSSDKNFVVPPNEESSKVIDFKFAGLRVTNYTLNFNGIYKASALVKPLNIPNFVFPAETNQFTVGQIACTLKSSKIETEKSVAKFDCVYSGDGVLILDPYKSSAVMSNGAANENKKKYNGTILEKGNNEDFTIVFEEMAGAGDMKKLGFAVKWNDSFKETKLAALKAVQLEVVKDIEKQ
ncbi:MAG: hypothetical protein ACK504_09060 [Bacteroidota bacterium]